MKVDLFSAFWESRERRVATEESKLTDGDVTVRHAAERPRQRANCAHGQEPERSYMLEFAKNL